MRQGDRIRLIRCTDPYTTLQAGQKGTVTFVDAFGTVHVYWDDGHSLGLIPGVDEWETIEEAA